MRGMYVFWIVLTRCTVVMRHKCTSIENIFQNVEGYRVGNAQTTGTGSRDEKLSDTCNPIPTSSFIHYIVLWAML